MGAERGEENNVEQPDNAGGAEGLGHISSEGGGRGTSLLTTLALTFAASARLAPMRLATRVEAAMEIGNGIWNVRAVRVLRIL